MVSGACGSMYVCFSRLYVIVLRVVVVSMQIRVMCTWGRRGFRVCGGVIYSCLRGVGVSAGCLEAESRDVYVVSAFLEAESMHIYVVSAWCRRFWKQNLCIFTWCRRGVGVSAARI